MEVEEDAIMGGLNGTESNSLQSTEPNGETVTVDPTILGPTSLKDAAPLATDPAISPSPPRVGSRTLPGVEQDEIMDDESTNSSSSDEEDGLEDLSRKPTQVVEVVVNVPAEPHLPYASSRTGLVYDAQMRFHAELNSDEDDIHPEDPRRIWEIYNELVKAGLVDDDQAPAEYSSKPFKLWRIPARLAEPAEVRLVHKPELYEWVAGLREWSDDELIEIGRTLDSVYLHKTTMYCARLSCGGAIEACRAVVAGQVKNAIAVIRPPGHHAEHGKPGGFCFFNNVCVAARVCQNTFGNACRKIFILDWDVHHGNGVQQAFESDPNVLYISLHVHKNGQFYPPGNYGDHLHCGIDPGLGKNINIPWPTHGMRDADYLYAFQQVVMPVAQEFDPDLVIISAGFDAAEGDMLGACHISPAGFAHMTHMLMSLANGKVVVCLEGGYNLTAIAKSACAVTRTLMGEPPDRVIDLTPSKVGVETVELVKRTQSAYWKCLYPKDQYQKRMHRGGERLHDLLRKVQAYEWMDAYKMVPLWINHERISKSFENQVLATSNYAEKRPLLVIFHDPPDTIGASDPVTNKLEPHNIVVTDATKTYVEWAIKNGFAVIDVNIPSHNTNEGDIIGYVEPDSVDLRAATTRELATYLWENYIEVNDSTDIILMGIGAAYAGIVWLLSNEEGCQDRVSHVIGFVADSSILGVSRPADDGVSSWYCNSSHIYVARNHYFWSPDRPRKQRKRYGTLIQSTETTLIDMMATHQPDVFHILEEEIGEWREEVRREELERQRREVIPGRESMPHRVPPSIGVDGIPASPVKGPMSPVPIRSPAKGAPPPMGIFQVTSSPDRLPKGIGSPASGSPSRR